MNCARLPVLSKVSLRFSTLGISVRLKLFRISDFGFRICGVALLLASILLVGCQHAAPQFTPWSSLGPAPGAANTNFAPVALTNRIDPSWLQSPTDKFTLGPGDKIDVEFLGETNSLTTTVVGPDGKIYFNLLPGIDVWGLTLAQAKAQLERELSKYVREQPQVSLVLRAVESKQVWVLGYVQAPGVYPLNAPMTLLEAVSMAGGTMSLSSLRQQEAVGASDELADLRHSFVLREGRLLPVDFQRLLQQGDLSQNIYLRPGDFVYFPQATTKEVYVLGAVAQPRAVPYLRGMTVAAAVASAYGTINGAYMHHVVVIRGSLSHPDMAVVDYRNVLQGKAPDVALDPQDIVYVPFSPYRYLIRYAQMALDTFVSAAAINAGSQAVVTQPTAGAGVFIPIGSGIQVIPPVSPPPIR